MAAKPVTITEAAMRAILCAGKRLPDFTVENGQLVAAWTVNRQGAATGMLVKVYTSVFSGQSRPVGEDSIRVCLVDAKRGKGLKKMAWTCRTEGWDRRLVDKIRETFEIAYEIPTCPKCSSPMQARMNRATGEGFFGCSDYPNCRGTRPMPKPVEAAD